ncbi:FxLD family lanthipeptide [Streptosporangium sandarakinum]|uniref:FxLD family lanthipeptide n=1 Tax=Streptosporangium sandarakinum TaxID=1260955 RepID=UPI0037BA4ABE
MTTPTITPSAEPREHADDPFGLNITFIENTPAAAAALACSTGDTCGSSCPSACTTS